jgi:integrase/recombinase XerD
MKEYHVLKINSIPNLPRAPPSIILCAIFSVQKNKILEDTNMSIIEKTIKELKMSGLAEQTCQSYLCKIKVFLNNIKKETHNINVNDIKKYLYVLRYEKNYCIGTVNYIRSALRFFYEAVLEKHWLDKKIPRYKGYKPLPSILSKAEVFAFIELMPNKMYQLILFTMYSSGLRVGETVALRIKDIDSDRMQIYVAKSKSGRGRYAILSKRNLEQLRKHLYFLKKYKRYSLNPDNFLFPSPHLKGNHITAKTIKNRISEIGAVSSVNKKITSHSLRHAFGTHLVEAGVDIYRIKELLGHSSLSSTNVYLHLASFSSMNVKSPMDMEDK